MNTQSKIYSDSLGCFIYYNEALCDCLVKKRSKMQMTKPESHTIEIDGTRIMSGVDPCLILIVKDMIRSVPYVGSVRIKSSTLLKSQLGGPYKMKLTLFGEKEDDLFTGNIGDPNLNRKDPSVLIELTFLEIVHKPFQKAVIQKASARDI